MWQCFQRPYPLDFCSVKSQPQTWCHGNPQPTKQQSHLSFQKARMMAANSLSCQPEKPLQEDGSWIDPQYIWTECLSK